MKQVKIMLMAVLVMAVVGGALAFKAKKANFCLYTTALGAPQSAQCALVKQITTTSGANNAKAFITPSDFICADHEVGELTDCNATVRTTVEP